jgi:hypothetical protein
MARLGQQLIDERENRLSAGRARLEVPSAAPSVAEVADIAYVRLSLVG